jgi:hypothetical protein
MAVCERMPERRVDRGLLRNHHRDILTQATRLAEAGQLFPSIDPRRFSLGSVESTYDTDRGLEAQGKIMIDLRDVTRVNYPIGNSI